MGRSNVCDQTQKLNSLLPPNAVFSIRYRTVTRLPFVLVFQEDVMQMVITFMAVVAGLVFSVAVALVVEELIFGQVFRVFFTPQPVRVKSAQTR